jgi:hypothetical protein
MSDAPVSDDRAGPSPALGTRRRLFPLGIAAVGVAVYFFLAPRAPVDQGIRIVLGEAAPRVTEVDVRYVATGANPDVAREVTFRYAPGAAPRIVSHEPRLANGDYVVQMEFDLSTASPQVAQGHVTVDRPVTLLGGTTSLDVSRALLRSDPSHAEGR